MRNAALVVALLAGGCATVPFPQLVLPDFERTNLEKDEYDEVAAQLPSLVSCMRARRPGCGLEQDYLEYFDGKDIDALFGPRHVEGIWFRPDQRGDSGTIEVTFASASPGARGEISFELRSGHWRPIVAAMLVTH
jgi:hypothetical protein